MPENKPLPTKASVAEFLYSIENVTQQTDARQLCDLMYDITHELPKMWGPSIVGFGKYHYKYASGREGDFPWTGFSPRKNYLTIYVVNNFDIDGALLNQLGPHKIGRSCLYIKRLIDIDMVILRQLITASVKEVKSRYPSSEALKKTA